MAYRYVTEQGDLSTDIISQRILASAYQNIRLDSHSLEFFYAGLGRFGLHLSGSTKVRDQGNMNKNGIVMSHIMLELTDGFQERLTLNITNCPAYLDDGNSVLIRCFCSVKTALDLVGDMRDYLYSTSAKITVTLFLKNRPVNLTGCHIGILVKAFINETLIMSKIKVCLCTVIGYKNLSMLNGVHSSRVNINVGIKFLHGHLIPSGFQKAPKRRCGNSFSQTGNNSTCYKNILYCHLRFPPPCCAAKEKAPGTVFRGENAPLVSVPDAFVSYLSYKIWFTINYFFLFVNN